MFFSHLVNSSSSNSKSDESDYDGDIRKEKKVYNLSDILSTPPSGFYHNEYQQRQSFEHLHYKPSQDNEKKKERYYIYSHIKSVVNDDVEEIHQQEDSNRKVRSSSMDRKQVSRNISMVLENLLMSYENSQLPTHGEGLINLCLNPEFYFCSKIHCLGLIDLKKFCKKKYHRYETL